MPSKFYTGDSLEVLRTLPDCSVQCVVTSPPYWGLRDYGIAGQLGLESTPDDYLAKMTEVFREVRRVLRDDGTCWVNMGDSYAPTTAGFKPKNLVGMPWRLAFALQSDGWYLRSDIIWHKPNPMPESVRDRPTKAHEYIFLLTKSSRYFWDSEGAKENAIYGKAISQEIIPQSGCKAISSGLWRNCGNAKKDPERKNNRRATYYDIAAGRNIRSVWTIPTKPFKESHFATFPPALVERCVKAGTSERGCCPNCGKALIRKTSLGRIASRDGSENGIRYSGNSGTDFLGGSMNCGMIIAREHIDLGFHVACKCATAEPIRCVVLDPFSGTGTVALVCERLGRDSIGIELNPKYVAMAERRLERNRRRKVNGHGKEVQDLPGQAQFAWLEK